LSVDEVRVERAGPVAVLLVDRPAARNALAPATVEALGRAVDAIRADASVRAVVLAGGGGHFIAGGDLTALEAIRTAPEAEAFAARVQSVLAALSSLPVPVIAAVDAFAYGGGVEVALAADLRIASAGARIGFRQIDFAVTTAWGGARRLARLVGPARALDLLWCGAELDAAEALRLGLVQRVAPAGTTARDAALALARELAARPPAVVAAFKSLVSASALDDAEHGALEARLFGGVWSDAAHWDAVRAFWARRGARAGGEEVRVAPTTGRFIVLEGLDGAGTTTQARLLSRWLRRQGRTVVSTAEPSAGPVGTLLRQALAGRVVGRDGARLTPETIALLFAADRADHLRAEIEPALAAGADVICDRYDWSSLAYQGSETDVAWVAAVNAPMRRPDLVLLLRVEAEVAGERRARRAGQVELYEVDAFQRRVAAGYDAASRHRPGDRLVVIDGARDVRFVQRACRAAVAALPVAPDPADR
jgi:dTMP kinase